MKKLILSLGCLAATVCLQGGSARAETYSQTETSPYNDIMNSRTQTESRTATHSKRETYTQTETRAYDDSRDSRSEIFTNTRTSKNSETDSSTAGMDGNQLWVAGAAAQALMNGKENGDKHGEYHCDAASGAPRCTISKISPSTAKILYPAMPARKGSVRQLGPLKCGKDNCRYPGATPNWNDPGSQESGATAK